MSKRLETFIEKYFHEHTIDKQLEKQQEIIKKANEHIAKLNALKGTQHQKPWHKWYGVRFKVIDYEHINHYKDESYGPYESSSYNEFVCDIIRRLDEKLKENLDIDTSDFIIFAPTGEHLVFEGDKAKELPLVAEYFEREKLRQDIKETEKKMEVLDREIEELRKEMAQTDKYTSSYIASLGEKVEQLLKEKESLEKEKNQSAYQRIEEINKILVEIDLALFKKTQ